MSQEQIALGIVAMVVVAWGVRVFRVYLAHPLATWLLRRGRVKWAMFIQHRVVPHKNPPKNTECCDGH